MDDSPRLLKEVRAAIDRGDVACLKRAIHALKGSVANFGAARVEWHLHPATAK